MLWVTPVSAPKSDICPLRAAWKCELLTATMRSSEASRAARFPNLSSAPTLIRHSSARLPTARRSTRRAKSFRSAKGFSLRASRIRLMEPSPTFLTALKPKRMEVSFFSPFSMVKSHAEQLISGCSTGIPMLRASATYSATLAVSLRVIVSSAVIYSAG